MKLFIVQELAYEYNDETYTQPQQLSCEGCCGHPVKAFKTKKNAEDERKRLNEAHLKDNPLEHEDGVHTDYYGVVEVEVTDEDVEGYAEARARIEAAEEEARAACKKAFTKEANLLFEKFPNLESFAWNQYTPFFNDGDTCYFCVHADEPDINGLDDDEIEFDSGKEFRGMKIVKVREPNEAYLTRQAVTQFIYQFRKQDLEHMFGDHIKVTVYRDGKTEVEDYDHD